MLVLSVYKSIILVLQLLCFTNYPIQGIPISKSFSLKFNPNSKKQQVIPKLFDALSTFPRETPRSIPCTKIQADEVSEQPTELGNVTIQVDNMLYSDNITNKKSNGSRPHEMFNYIKIPVMKQSIADTYNILVATAPHNITLSNESGALPTVLYVVFPGEVKLNETGNIHLPAIYFVNRGEGKTDITKKEKAEPIFIVDSNRKVTGLKSKEVSKFVRFKSKLINLYDNDVSRV